MNYIFTPATQNDIDFVYDLHKASNYDHVYNLCGWDDTYQRNELEFGIAEGGYSIIELDKEPVGIMEINELSNELHLCELHLVQSARGKGLGSQIIKEVIRASKMINKALKTGCFKDNKRVKCLYESLGFVVVGESDTHYKMEYKG